MSTQRNRCPLGTRTLSSSQTNVDMAASSICASDDLARPRDLPSLPYLILSSMPLYCGSKNAASALLSPSIRSMSSPSILFGRFRRCLTFAKEAARRRLFPTEHPDPKTVLRDGLCGLAARALSVLALNCAAPNALLLIILAGIRGLFC